MLLLLAPFFFFFGKIDKNSKYICITSAIFKNFISRMKDGKKNQTIFVYPSLIIGDTFLDFFLV